MPKGCSSSSSGRTGRPAQASAVAHPTLPLWDPSAARCAAHYIVYGPQREGSADCNTSVFLADSLLLPASLRLTASSHHAQEPTVPWVSWQRGGDYWAGGARSRSRREKKRAPSPQSILDSPAARTPPCCFVHIAMLERLSRGRQGQLLSKAVHRGLSSAVGWCLRGATAWPLYDEGLTGASDDWPSGAARPSFVGQVGFWQLGGQLSIGLPASLLEIEHAGSAYSAGPCRPSDPQTPSHLSHLHAHSHPQHLPSCSQRGTDNRRGANQHVRSANFCRLLGASAAYVYCRAVGSAWTRSAQFR